jgi:hypothetical protein
VILQMFDSWSSNIFISEVASARVQSEFQNIDPVAVKVANGRLFTAARKLSNWNGGVVEGHLELKPLFYLSLPMTW